MNNRIILVVFVFIALTFTSGCSGNDVEEESTISDYKGISVEFMPGAPPEQISEDDVSFDLAVKVENNGEYDLNLYELDETADEDDPDRETGDLISVFL